MSTAAQPSKPPSPPHKQAATRCPSWSTWRFEDIESKLQAYVEKTGAPYDANHPFEALGPGTAKRALKALGSTYANIARISSINIKTVQGWFSPNNNPTRKVIATGIYPALCEAYVRHHKEFSLTTSLAHNDSQDADLLMFDVLTVGKPLSFQARKALARRILILLTEGVLVTYKDAMVEYEAARERFSRSCLRMAACMLQGEDLNAAARLIMSMAGARQVHTPLGPDSPTPLFHSDMLWAGEIDQGLDASPITSTREASARMTDLAQEMEEWIVDYKLEAMSENELRIVVSKIRAIHESNLQVQA